MQVEPYYPQVRIPIDYKLYEVILKELELKLLGTIDGKPYIINQNNDLCQSADQER